MDASDHESNVKHVTEDTRKRPRCAVIILSVLLLGVITILFLSRWWFAPPALHLTPIVMVVGAFAWLPVLVGCAVRRPRIKARVALLLILLGVIAAFIELMLAGPTLGTFLRVSSFSEPLDCTAGVTTEDRTQYTCQYVTAFSTNTLTLEGPAGGLFVRIIGHEGGS